jgi:hypothetical protein
MVIGNTGKGDITSGPATGKNHLFVHMREKPSHTLNLYACDDQNTFASLFFVQLRILLLSVFFTHTHTRARAYRGGSEIKVRIKKEVQSNL